MRLIEHVDHSQFELSSTFDLTEYVRLIEHVDHSQFELSSTFDLTEYVRLIDYDYSQFELSLTFDPKVELYPFRSIQIAIWFVSRRDGKRIDDDCL